MQRSFVRMVITFRPRFEEILIWQERDRTRNSFQNAIGTIPTKSVWLSFRAFWTRTDSSTSTGSLGIEQTSQRLAQDIEELVQSLGGTVLTRLREVNGYRAKKTVALSHAKPVWRQVI